MITRCVAAAFVASVILLTPIKAQETVPDFSGIWGHLLLPPFEPPLSGPGPVTNRSRRGVPALATGNQPAAGSSRINGFSNLAQLVGDYTNPILKPEAAEVVKQRGEISLKGVPYPSPSNRCRPGGVPYVFWNLGMQMLQQPDTITILYSEDHEVRRIRMNAQHPAAVTPSYYGDSVGHYEGGTLVIDTVGFKKGPFAMLDFYGTPYTEGLHVVERYRLIDYDAAKTAAERPDRDGFDIPVSDPGFILDTGYRGKGLQLEFTVEDGAVFTTPWSATVTYRRALTPLGGWPEYVCADNPFGYFPEKETDIPTSGKPDF